MLVAIGVGFVASGEWRIGTDRRLVLMMMDWRERDRLNRHKMRERERRGWLGGLMMMMAAEVGRSGLVLVLTMLDGERALRIGEGSVISCSAGESSSNWRAVGFKTASSGRGCCHCKLGRVEEEEEGEAARASCKAKWRSRSRLESMASAAASSLCCFERRRSKSWADGR
ncbi:hypothetical protein RIF29_04762 [Crotalaria pallida]|uniref:Uncharacterized protein n=1 Tax=Crotalaria pallida TaxID=3830 RepID=A0AAN9J3U7_CROPI